MNQIKYRNNRMRITMKMFLMKNQKLQKKKLKNKKLINKKMKLKVKIWKKCKKKINN